MSYLDGCGGQNSSDSHELGRPLGALRSAVYALSTGAANDPALLNDLTQGMEQETVHVKLVLDDLAHLHEQELGILELKREKLALSEWLPAIIRPWQEAAVEKKQEWRADIPPDLPVVEADSIRLAQIIGNLVDNAVKYTPSEGKIWIGAGSLGEQAWIRVADNGPGIPVEEQKMIFTPCGPVDKAGLLASTSTATILGQNVRVGGDVIIKINDTIVNSMDDLIAYLSDNTEVGQKVNLTFLRNGKEQSAEVTLAARPATPPATSSITNNNSNNSNGAWI